MKTAFVNGYIIMWDNDVAIVKKNDVEITRYLGDKRLHDAYLKCLGRI